VKHKRRVGEFLKRLVQFFPPRPREKGTSLEERYYEDLASIRDDVFFFFSLLRTTPMVLSFSSLSDYLNLSDPKMPYS